MEKHRTVRLAGIAFESLVNGPGIRRVLFAQGCKHDCKGCFNPDTHDFNGGIDYNIDKLINDVKENPLLKGVTFSGGDPFEQAEQFAYIAKKLKVWGKNIWCYTGYTFEYILTHRYERKGWNELLQNIDVLVDGKFEQDKSNPNLKFRGSSNQRIIDVKNSLKVLDIVVYNEAV